MAGIKGKQAWLSDLQFIHRKLQNPQGSGRSSDLLRLFSTPSRPFGDGQWHSVETFKELTAAGTVAGFHDIPYYPFPEPMHGKSRKIIRGNASFYIKFSTKL